jgi:uncharacterized protein (DUF1778 family)
MPTAQLNIRLSPAQRAKITRNARAYGQKPTDYVRSLIDREDEAITGVEIHRRATASVRRLRKAGMIPAK